MENEWKNQIYKIEQHADGRIFTERVSGAVCGGFGVHETGSGWNVTHLKSGWATFVSRTEEGAKIIALHLIENYAADFERLEITGCMVENFKPPANGSRRTPGFGA